MVENIKNNYVINKFRDNLTNLFCRLVVIITLVLILINGIIFFKYLFELIKSDIHSKSNHLNY